MILGGVFLCITGGEALYADMGHIGRFPIRMAWFVVVLPALLINYAGQTALLLGHESFTGNPFFLLAPHWLILPLVALSTVATIIASQAIITGSFSMTRQAMQLGWMPGVNIRQTSDKVYGQIYVPVVNWLMMGVTVAITIGFGSSDRLAGAYGTAVSTTMLATTGLLLAAMLKVWKWPPIVAYGVAGAFLIVDFAFFSANLLKILDGGVAAAHLRCDRLRDHDDVARGARRHSRDARPQRHHGQSSSPRTQRRAPDSGNGAIFLTRRGGVLPNAILEHVHYISGAIQEVVVALTIVFEQSPRVLDTDRFSVREEQTRPYRTACCKVTIRYGFIEKPDTSHPALKW